MPFNATIQSILYKPALLASARIRFLDRKYGVDVDQSKTVLINQPEKNGLIRWENFVTNKFFDNLETIPSQDGKYESIDSPLSDAKRMNALQKDFSDWIYREFTVKARVNRALKVFVGPDVSQAEFMTMCSESARNAADAQIVKETKSIDKQLKTLNDRLAREQRELRQDEEELQSRKVEELGTHAENVLGLFTGSRSTRKLSSSLSKRRLTENAKADVEESIDSIAQYQRQIKELEIQREEIKKTISEYWSGLVNEKEEVNISPKKTDIFVEIFGVAWLPYYVVANNEEPLPAFGSE